MLNCQVVTTPMNQNKPTADDQAAEADGQKYRMLVGKLIYLSHSRPDIVFTVGVLLRFMSKPSINHYGAGKRLLR